MAVAALNNRVLTLNLFFLFTILFITALVIAKLILKKEKPCEEICIVGERETLQTMNQKYNTPFILVNNSQIENTDDIYEGMSPQITYKM